MNKADSSVKTSWRPSRVLMLVENNSFPWDRRMRHLAYMLKEDGYEVSVICPMGEDNEKASFEIVNGVRVYRYPMLFQASGAAGYILEYSWAFLCAALLSLVVWMRHGIDVIHSANPPDMFYILARFYKLFGKKYVYDQHDLCPELYESKFERTDWPYRLLLKFERNSYETADLVISTNQSYADLAHERGGVTPERSAVVRNGVDLQRFHRKEPVQELKEGFRYMAVYLGVMGKQDGVDRVVRAAHELVHTLGRTDVLFAMIGNGECWEDLQKLSKDLGVDRNMRFLGKVSDDRILIDYLSTADVCLAPDPPNRLNQLSTMTKIMEYMACQRPIVSFDLLESRRSAAEAAMYVPGEDVREFARAIVRVLDDSVLQGRMSQAGLERSRKVVGLDRSRAALLEAYGRLTGKPRIREQMVEEEPETAGKL